MSTVVDERVVSMQFDNKNFETNVQTSMSTLEKLKQSLNLSGAAKGLDSVSTAAKKVDLSGISNGVDSVKMSFSALDVIAVTALQNITNQAINAGKKIVSALTIDSVKSGFEEYETQINAVQTILANTSSKGTTLDDVNEALDELNTYADKTIYNFTEMTKNIGTFTAAGIDLDTSVSAIQGIANLAAVSGSTSQQASTAMYQLSQALAAGTVKLMDWNSVVNAGMGGEIFQNALKETSELLGTGAEAAIEAEGSFRESLSTGWLTAEVLTETLKKFTTSGANEYVAEYTGLSEEAVEAALESAKAQYGETNAIEKASEALAKKSGKNQDEIQSVLEMATTAEDAATKVKTFTQLIDTLKEAMQSGWTQTWEILIGDFEEAKALFTEISDALGNMINESSESRNNLLEGVFSSDSQWDSLITKINNAGISTKEFRKTLKQTARENGIHISSLIKEYGSLSNVIEKGLIPAEVYTQTLQKFADTCTETVDSTEDLNDKLEEFTKVVNDVWSGDYDNGEARINALTEAGYDYAEVQELVNKTVDGYVLTLDDLNTEQLKSVGYTDEQIKKIQKLAKNAEKTGTSINKLITSLSRPTGRELVIDTVKNALSGMLTIIESIKSAWTDVFPTASLYEQQERLYNLIDTIHSFSERLKVSDETADKIRRTFKGLFSILDLVGQLVKGVLNKAFSALSKVFGNVNIDILGITASIGDALTAFHDFVTENELITKAINAIAEVIEKAVESITSFVKSIADVPQVSGIISNISSNLGNFSSLAEVGSSIGSNIITAIQDGLVEGALSLPNFTTQLVNEAFESIPDTALGSTTMTKNGENLVVSMASGIKSKANEIINAFGDIGWSVADMWEDYRFGTLLSSGLAVSFAAVGVKLSKSIENITSPLGGLGDVLSGVGEVLTKSARSINRTIKSFSKVVSGFASILSGFGKIEKSIAFDIKMGALKNIAIAIGLMALSVFLLAQLSEDQLTRALFAVGMLGVIFYALVQAFSKMNMGEGFNFAKIGVALLSLGTCIILISASVKLLASIPADQFNQGIIGLAAIIVFLGILDGLFELFSSFGTKGKNISKFGSMMLKLSIALLILVGVVKLIGMLSTEEMQKGAAFIAAYGVFIESLTAVSSLANNNVSKVGSMALKISIALLILVGVVKLVGMLSWTEMGKGALFCAAFLVFLEALVLITKMNKHESQIAGLGTMLLSISIAMVLMVGVCKLAATLTPEEAWKGAAFAAAFIVFVGILVAVTTISNEQQTAKVAATILAFGVAIGILAAVAIVLGMVDTTALARGVVAVVLFGLIISLMIVATKGASSVSTGTFIGMAICIGVMAAAAAVLSMLDPSGLARGVTAISVLMLAFAVMAKGASNVNSSLGCLIVMTAAIAIMAGAVYMLSQLNPEGVAVATAAIAALMVVFGLVANGLNVVDSSLKTIIVMTVAIAALGGITYFLARLPVENVLGAATALSELMLSLAATMAIISSTGSLSLNAIASIAAMVVVVGLLGGILYLLRDLNPESSIAIATSLSEMILALSAACAICSQFVNVESAINGALGLASFLGIMVTVLGVIGEINNLLNGGVVGSLESAGDVLEAVGSAIGKLVGGLIGGVAEGATSSLPEVGTNLSQFAENVGTFVDAMSGMDTSVLEGVKNLASAIKTLSTANLTEMVSSFFTGGETSSLSKFGSELPAFGEALNEFSTSVGDIDGENISKAAEAGKLLAEMAKTIPNEGGLLGDIFGENGLDTFSENITAYGEAIVGFSEAVTNAKIDTAAIQTATEAGGYIIDMAKDIPNDGGVLGFFVGDNNLGDFSTNITSFGEAIVGFSEAVSETGAINPDAIQTAADAGIELINMANSIQNYGGVAGFFTGKKSLGSFGTQLEKFAQSLVNISTTLSGTELDVELFTTMGTCVSRIALISTSAKNLDAEACSTFKVGVTDLVSALKKANSTDVSNIDAFITAVSNISSMKVDTSSLASSASAVSSSVETMMSTMSSTISGSQSSINDSMGTALSGASGEIESYSGSMSASATALVNAVGTALGAGSATVNAGCRKMMSGAASTIRSYRSSFYSAGGYVASGLVTGISSKSSAVYQAAYAIGRRAANAAKAGAQTHSPSKITTEVGENIGEGLIVGMNNMADSVTTAGENLGETAANSLSGAVSKISDLLDSDLDTAPTIRPVLDLSSVSSGIGTLNGMISGSSVQVLSDIGSIGTSVDRIQNGSNSDVVSAIKDLKGSLGNSSGDTYQINGVTYDDGSNITDAVQSIVRAARIERRS